MDRYSLSGNGARRMVTAVLHNIRSVYNVGAILRTAEGLGVSRVVYSGYTPVYGDPRLLPHLREKLNRQIAKAALGAEEMVKQEIVEDLPSWLEEQKATGKIVVGLENNLAADEETRKVMLDVAREKLGFDTEDTELVLVLGEEVHGIPADVRERCQHFLEIPMHGRKESFNVSVATAMALWELTR